jgi:hypothetical protein
MANTKKIENRTMRKGIKRAQRRALKEVYAGLSAEQRKKFHKADEKVGLRVYVASLEK